MSKPSHFAPTPMGSRPTSPPPGYSIEEEAVRDKQALMMDNLGADRAKESAQSRTEGGPPPAQEQGE